MEVIFGIICAFFVIALLLYLAIFLVMGLAYAYWGLSILVAHILWLLIVVGALIGFFSAVRNAVKASRALHKGK